MPGSRLLSPGRAASPFTELVRFSAVLCRLLRACLALSLANGPSCVSCLVVLLWRRQHPRRASRLWPKDSVVVRVSGGRAAGREGRGPARREPVSPTRTARGAKGPGGAHRALGLGRGLQLLRPRGTVCQSRPSVLPPLWEPGEVSALAFHCVRHVHRLPQESSGTSREQLLRGRLGGHEVPPPPPPPGRAREPRQSRPEPRGRASPPWGVQVARAGPARLVLALPVLLVCPLSF